MIFRRQPPTWQDAEVLTAGLVTLTALLALVAVRLPHAWQPTCLFKQATGFPCLTCGAWRAASALCAGNPGAAFRVQPLLTVLALASLAWVVYAAAGAWLHLPRVRMVPSRREMWLLAGGVALVVLANWAYLLAHGV